MAQIDFYLLSTPNPNQRDLFVARLLESLYRKGHRLWVRLPDSLLAHWDDYLWTYRPESFLPHGISSDQPNLPIVLSPEPPMGSFICINLSDTPINDPSIERGVEILADTPEQRAQGRERYRWYQSQGYLLKTHRIDSR